MAEMLPATIIYLNIIPMDDTVWISEEDDAINSKEYTCKTKEDLKEAINDYIDNHLLYD